MAAAVPPRRASSWPWILCCIGVPAFFAAVGVAGLIVGTNENIDGVRILGSVCVYVVLVAFFSLAAMAVDIRVFRPAFRLPAGTSDISKSDNAPPRAWVVLVATSLLWLCRILGLLLILLALVGNSNRFTSASRVGGPNEATLSPRSDPPEYVVLGQAATGPLSQLLWTWLVAELFFHLYLLGRHLYQQRQRKQQATAARAPAEDAPTSKHAPSVSTPVDGNPNTVASGWGAVPGQNLRALTPALGLSVSSAATVAPMEVEASVASAQGDVRSRGLQPTLPSSISAVPPTNKDMLARGPHVNRLQRKIQEGFPGRCCTCIPCPCRGKCFAFFCYADLPRPLALIVILLTFALSVAGLAIGFAAPTVYHYNVQLARLPAQATGFRVGVLADLHIGLAVGATRLAVPVASVLAQKPHLVLLSGDLMDNDEHVYGIAWEPLRAIGIACNSSSPAAQASIQRMLTSTTPGAAGQETVCLGAFAVFGNHDGDGGSPQRKVELLEGMGITVLTNDRIAVPSMLANVASAQMPPGTIQYFDLIGVSDYATSTKDNYQVATRLKPANISSVASMAKAVENRDSSKELLVLAHQPRHAMEAASVGGGLMMSGHTHGGQLLPASPLSGAVNDGLVAGLYEYQRNPTHSSNPQNLRAVVNRGTYQYGFSFRHVPSEVSLITLQAP